MSEGGAYVHNLLAGKIVSRPEPRRFTPFHKAHSTAVAGSSSTTGGDDRFYNNIFGVGNALSVYDQRGSPIRTGGNVFLRGDVKPDLADEGDRVYLSLDPSAYVPATPTARVTTEVLGKAKVPDLPYENPDGSPLAIDTDYSGRARIVSSPSPGPFENPKPGRQKVW
jgi:hypothetical protein